MTVSKNLNEGSRRVSTILVLAYNLLLFGVTLLALPVLLVGVLNIPKRKKTVLQRLGIRVAVRRRRKRPIWVHALSVGEVLCSVPLVTQIRTRYPDRPLVFSVSTWTGHGIAQEKLEAAVDDLFFFPYDFPYSVHRVVKRVAPALFFLVESDIWPNLLHTLNRRQVPVVLVNGRVSPRSFRGYRRFGFVVRHVFSCVSLICVQSKLDAARLAAVGIPSDKITVTGNLKFDQETAPVSREARHDLRKQMAIADDAMVWVAGSTHEGEETLILEALLGLKRSFGALVSIVVPRDPERARPVCRQARQMGLDAALWSQLEARQRRVDVLVVDRIGLLGRLYSLADIAFVGGSLVRAGGHNPLEPAAFGKPIIFGPDMSDFSAISEMLVAERGAIQVTDEKDLFEQIQGLLKDETRLRVMGDRARHVFEANRGAVERTLDLCENFLDH